MRAARLRAAGAAGGRAAHAAAGAGLRAGRRRAPAAARGLRSAARLQQRDAGRRCAGCRPLYTEANVVITATHTHCGPGGYSHHAVYNGNTGGFRPQTFRAIVDGIVEAARRAIADLQPATLRLNRGELHDASVNRSRRAFDRNPSADKAVFPDAVDPATTLLTVERDGVPVGLVNWFAVHNTSMTNRNRLVSADNKGYAAYHWEREVSGIDYLAEGADPGLITAFAQTNAGDMSPNLNLRPGSGPTEDEFENTRIIGTAPVRSGRESAGGEGATPRSSTAAWTTA